MSEKLTAFPARSFSVSAVLVNPSCFSKSSAAFVLYGIGFRFLSNQNLFAGLNSPTEGVACPRKATRARSARLIAVEIARRKLRERNHAFLKAGIGAFVTSLNQNCSD